MLCVAFQYFIVMTPDQYVVRVSHIGNNMHAHLRNLILLLYSTMLSDMCKFCTCALFFEFTLFINVYVTRPQIDRLLSRCFCSSYV